MGFPRSALLEMLGVRPGFNVAFNQRFILAIDIVTRQLSWLVKTAQPIQRICIQVSEDIISHGWASQVTLDCLN